MTHAMPDRPRPVVSRAPIANDGAHAMTVILAPGARERLLAPGETAVVEARGPAGDHAELLVERTCDTVVAWAWPGAEMRLLGADGGALIDWTASSAAPDPP
jgi:hypothetical protein